MPDNVASFQRNDCVIEHNISAAIFFVICMKKENSKDAFLHKFMNDH